MFWGRSNKVREVFRGTLGRNRRSDLGFVVSVEMKQEDDQAEASTRRVLNIDESKGRTRLTVDIETRTCMSIVVIMRFDDILR